MMQTADAIRVAGLSADLTQQMSKFDSSEFDDDKEVPNSDAEGVWAPEIEQSFQEALAIYPPCGRRKIILSDEGKMYGRNELIARYIKLRTGKTRTRKQVSSHIQVLARRRVREVQAKLKVPGSQGPTSYLEQAHREKALQSMQQMSSAQIVSASAMHKQGLTYPPVPPMPVGYNGQQSFWQPHGLAQHHPATATAMAMAHQQQQHHAAQQAAASAASQDVKPFAQSPFGLTALATTTSGHHDNKNSIITSAAASMLAHASAVAQQQHHHTSTGSASSSPPAQTMLPQQTQHDGQQQQLLRQSPPSTTAAEVWQGRAIATQKLRLLEFSAYMEQPRESNEAFNKHLFVHIGGPVTYADPVLEPIDVRQIQDKFPEKKGGLKELYDKGPSEGFFLVKFWADLNTNISDEAGAFYGVTTTYESNENMTIQCSTKVCSFGKQVVEKLETEIARFENGKYVYKINRSPMCDYMINFIQKLKHLPEKYMMNSVLENFTILQVITNRDTGETLLCIAYVFEVSTSEHGAQHHIYRLVKD